MPAPFVLYLFGDWLLIIGDFTTHYSPVYQSPVTVSIQMYCSTCAFVVTNSFVFLRASKRLKSLLQLRILLKKETLILKITYYPSTTGIPPSTKARRLSVFSPSTSTVSSEQ